MLFLGKTVLRNFLKMRRQMELDWREKFVVKWTCCKNVVAAVGVPGSGEKSINEKGSGANEWQATGWGIAGAAARLTFSSYFLPRCPTSGGGSGSTFEFWAPEGEHDIWSWQAGWSREPPPSESLLLVDDQQQNPGPTLPLAFLYH